MDEPRRKQVWSVLVSSRADHEPIRVPQDLVGRFIPPEVRDPKQTGSNQRSWCYFLTIGPNDTPLGGAREPSSLDEIIKRPLLCEFDTQDCMNVPAGGCHFPRSSRRLHPRQDGWLADRKSHFRTNARWPAAPFQYDWRAIWVVETRKWEPSDWQVLRMKPKSG
ncbi:hypothetical protein BDN72DRAFT_839503 [Pluteus cervinus]|uniref:Uncharacterized protein n=1 Tax=Pluteus cervinus TaxID=181527 RepID=A0ACD3AXH4_9AGAR|nr:hypothetical protein BDN72DRAFT_839503 [Pluteus cervinus]